MRFLDAQILTKAKMMNKTPTMTPPMQPSSIAEENFGFRGTRGPALRKMLQRCKVYL